MSDWRKSSYSDANGGSCLEAAGGSELIHVRDTINRGGSTLTFTASAGTTFTATLK